MASPQERVTARVSQLSHILSGADLAPEQAGEENETTTWQKRLEDLCAAQGLGQPVYAAVNDRIRGHNHWAYTVRVQQRYFVPRNWFDGDLEIAREDAAKHAFQGLIGNGIRVIH